MEEHCPGECCFLLKFAYFSLVSILLYISLSPHASAPCCCCAFWSGGCAHQPGPALSSLLSVHLSPDDHFFKIPFHFHFSMIQFHFHFDKNNFCCDHLHILVVPVWLEGLPFLILCTHSILQTFLCSCFKMFCIWGQIYTH